MKQIGLFFLSCGLSIMMISLLRWTIFATGTPFQAQDFLNADLDHPAASRSESFQLIASGTITDHQYLPLVQVWVPPCGGIPILISPPDGATVTMETIFAMDGSQAGGDWLQLDFSTSPDFTGFRRTSFLQPAGPWSRPLSEYTIYWTPSPGVYYWRTSVWCGGPAWPPPPEGYKQSPFSETRSFTLIP